MRIYMNTSYMCIYVYMHVSVRVIYMHIYTHLYISIQTCVVDRYIYIYTYIYICSSCQLHVHTCIQVYARMYVYVHMSGRSMDQKCTSINK